MKKEISLGSDGKVVISEIGYFEGLDVLEFLHKEGVIEMLETAHQKGNLAFIFSLGVAWKKSLPILRQRSIQFELIDKDFSPKYFKEIFDAFVEVNSDFLKTIQETFGIQIPST